MKTELDTIKLIDMVTVELHTLLGRDVEHFAMACGLVLGYCAASRGLRRGQLDELIIKKTAVKRKRANGTPTGRKEKR